MNPFEDMGNGTIKLHLRGGVSAVIDYADFDRVRQHRWYARRFGSRTYAAANMRSLTTTSGRTTVSMHRYILAETSSLDVDHMNHEGLDNRRSNLRVCTRTSNSGNQRKTRGRSQYKGVSWHMKIKKWIARIQVSTPGEPRKNRYLGAFSCEHDAAHTYNLAALDGFGGFACLNSHPSNKLLHVKETN